MLMNRTRVVALTLVSASLLVTGCQKEQAGPVQLPPPKVTVSRPIVKQLRDFKQFVGRLEPTETVEIRPRVRGYLDAVHFQEGQMVQEGDLLYEIDPRTYESELNKAEKEQARLLVQFQQADQEAARGQALRRTNAISEEEYVQRVTARNIAAALLDSSKAATRRAALELSFTKIYAPITGRISRTLVTRGNLVGDKEPTLLTTIVRTDPLFVYFEVTERDVQEYDARVRQEGLPTALDGNIPVFIGLASDKGYPHRGTLDFRDNRFDAGTGTLQVRGRVPNPDGRLIPGYFARVRVPIGKPGERLLIPDRAISLDQRGKYVWVVDAQNQVEYRPITTGNLLGEFTVIRSGLTPQDRVITDGLQRARRGAVVEPQEVSLDPAQIPRDDLEPTPEGS